MSLVLPETKVDSTEPSSAHRRVIGDWLSSLHVPTKHCLRKATAGMIVTGSSGKTKRELEFATGRDCATSLLAAFGEDLHVGVNEDRSPAWPNGFVGSISHSHTWTWATVARQSDLLSIGVDTESVVDHDTKKQIENEIATPSEWDIATRLDLGPQQTFTVVFSAKEAFYKCWYPLSGQFFGFDDAVIESVTPQSLRIQMTETNPNFGSSPGSLDIYFLIDEGNVFTVTWMEQE